MSQIFPKITKKYIYCNKGVKILVNTVQAHQHGYKNLANVCADTIKKKMKN